MTAAARRVARIVVVSGLLSAPAYGDDDPHPGDGTPVPEARAVELTAEAREQAVAGHCDLVARLDGRVHQLDALYYERSFTTDPAIEACLHPSREEHARTRFTAGLGVSVGTGMQGELHLGWMVTESIAMFGSVFVGTEQTEPEDNEYRVVAAGVRYWPFPRGFVDGRLGIASGYHDACTVGGDGCTKVGVGGWLGAGYEIVHESRYGLELHVEVAGGGGLAIVGAGIGASFY